jgi:hypothetical protein
MVGARRYFLVLLLLAGCKSSHSQSYLLRVTPTPLTVASADALSVLLQRSDFSAHQTYNFALPASKPSPPWQLDVHSGDWGSASFVVTVTATQNGNPISSGEGAPVNGVIDVQLVDHMGGNNDLAMAADLSGGTGADLLEEGDLLNGPPPDLRCPTVFFQPNAYAAITSATLANNSTAGALLLGHGLGVSMADTIGLLQFDVTALPLTANIQSMSLTLYYPSNANECGGSCSSCASNDNGGALDVYYLTTNWQASTCDWNNARTGNAITTVQWNTPGASGSGTDRSASRIGTVTSGGQQSAVIDIDPSTFNQISTWRMTNHLDFEVVPTSGTFVVATKNEGCTLATPINSPILQVVYCN